MNNKEIYQLSKRATLEILNQAQLKKNDIFVVGCSSSEVLGQSIGKGSSIDVAKSIFDGINEGLKENNIYLASQCCEHLNRAIIIEKEAKNILMEEVNVIPQINAGGSFATISYERFKEPIVVESIKADAGIDIGGTLIGMHLKNVAVPLRISFNQIGKANILCARTRPKFIGGNRAIYDDRLSKGEIHR